MVHKENFLVYDTSKGFSRFIKINFSSSYNIVTLKNYDSLKDVNYELFQVAFIVINDNIDLIIYNLLSSKINKVFVSSNIKFIDVVFSDNTVFINKSDVKKSVLKIIKSNLDSKN